MLQEGNRAPDFTLLDQDGKDHRLSDYQRQWVLLYFYPKDHTPGCTREACSMRDNFSAFEKINAKVFGISSDSVKSHKSFADKHKLNFSLLADPEKEVINLYKSKSPVGKGSKRVSYLVDPEGVIRKVYPKVNPDEHAQQALGDLSELT